ncbi:hypothetical protein [Thioalkalivibrio nitratireducens]|uniref:hypothetical protein n=1 Tax=Thioalkalivibrio nitratireducens TaxID=186931 RepID=UPI0026AC7A4C
MVLPGRFVPVAEETGLTRSAMGRNALASRVRQRRCAAVGDITPVAPVYPRPA